MKDRTPTFFVILFILIAGLTSFTATAQNETLYVTGDNNYGQLGLGDNSDRNTLTPITLPEGERVSQVVAKFYHSLILTEDGELYGTGNNTSHQLGLVDPTMRNTFVRIPVDIDKRISQIAAGSYHSLILTEDGELYGTGGNSRGQLGLGDDPSIRETFTKIPVPGGKRVTMIAAESNHSLIITEDGKLYVAGDNGAGQLGLGDDFDRHTFTLVDIPEAKKVTQIAAGSQHSLIVTEDGELYGTGRNDDGQLGLADYIYRYSFTNATVDGGKRVSRIEAGSYHSVILTNDGVLYTAGWNHRGQLGLNDTSRRSTFTQVPLPEGKRVSRIVGGSYHSLFITDEGELYVTGNNDNGELGLGDNTPRHVFEQVIPAAGKEVVSADARSHSLVIVGAPEILVSGFPSSTRPGESIAATLTAKNFAGTVTYTLSGDVPDGLSLVGDQIVGNPTVEGSYSLLVSGTDGTDSASLSLHLTIGLVATRSYNLCTNTFSYRYYPLNEEGIIAEPYEYEVMGSLPDGLKIEDGMLQGVVANTGTYNFSIVLTCGVDQLTLYYTIQVVAPTMQPVFCGVRLNGVYTTLNVVEGSTHATPAVTELYNAAVSAGVPLEMLFEWDYIKGDSCYCIAGGALPEGLALNPETGVISGAPTTPGEYIFVVSVKDWRGRAYQWVRLVVE